MKRLLLIAAVAAVLLSLGISWMRQRERAARRMENWQSLREFDAIPPVYSQSFTWEHADLTLAEFADLVSAKTGLKVKIDEAGIDGGRNRRTKPREIQVHVPAGDFPLDALIQMVLVPAGLYPDRRIGTLLAFTTRANSNNRIRTVVHPLPLDSALGVDESSWRQIIAGNIDGHVYGVPSAVIVVANVMEQQRVKLVIDTIQQLETTPREPITIPPPQPTAIEQQIATGLDSPAARLDVVEMPFRDVVRYLVEHCGVPIVLRADKLAEASVSLDTPITKSVKDISLRSLLNLMLKDLELTFVVRNQAIVITTPEDAESHAQTIAYPVQDLFASPDEVDADLIAHILKACIVPDAWGHGNRGIPPLGIANGWLLCHQTDYVHLHVAQLLDTLRYTLASPDHGRPVSIHQRGASENRIRAALERTIALDFSIGLPLKDVVTFLSEELGIPIVLSAKKLEEASVSQDTPISLKLPSARARQQLDAILKPLELDFVIRDEVLQITTPEDVESQLDVVVYDTRRLIGDRQSVDQLEQLIRSTVWPQTWDQVGGPGAVEIFRGLTIVSQTRHVQDAGEKLLESLAPKPQEHEK